MGEDEGKGRWVFVEIEIDTWRADNEEMDGYDADDKLYSQRRLP